MSVKPDLAALVADWQARLRLRDWRIATEYVADLRDSSGRPAYGLCYPFVDAKKATILIRDPEASAPIKSAPSIEETVVHELLHLHFAPFDNTAPAEIAAEEQAVWSIAEAIVTAKGSGREALIARAMAARVCPSRVRRAGGTMDPKIVAAAIAAIKSGDGEGALSMLEKMLVQAAGGHAEPDGDEAPPPAAAAEPPPAAEPDGDEKKPEPPAQAAEEKKPMASAVELSLAARVQALEAERAARIESDERAKLFAERPDFSKEVRQVLERAPLETLRDAVKTFPRVGAVRAAVATPEPARAPTRGEGQGAGDASRLPAEERRALDEAMGLRPRATPIRMEGTRQVLGVMTPEQARAHRAAQKENTR